MNDFFTELDADIFGTTKTPAPKKQDEILVKKEPKTQPERIVNEPKVPRPSSNIRSNTPRVQHEEKVQKSENGNRREEGRDDDFHSRFPTGNASPCIFPVVKPFSIPVLAKGDTRIIAIGGYNEALKNMTAYQNGEEILLIDSACGVPKNNMLGANYSLPDISSLIPIKRKIVGMIITNGQLENIEGLKHTLPALGYPKIYATKLTVGLIKNVLEEAGIIQNAKFHIVNPETGIFPVSKNFRIELFSQSYSIPDTAGVYIEAPNVKIVHTGDFKLDIASDSESQPRFGKLKQIGSRGIDVLLSDSTNSMKEGFTKTEAEIATELHEIISKTEGRIIVATSVNALGRIAQIIESAGKTGRTVFIGDRAMAKNITTLREVGYISHSPNIVKSITNKVDSTPENKKIILTTLGFGPEDSGLSKIVRGENPMLAIERGDSVIFSRETSPENERNIMNLMNSLIRLGATIFTKDWMDFGKSGHAGKEEQKKMIELIRPKVFIPSQGELFMRVFHKETARSVGILAENIILADNGSIIDIDEKGATQKHPIKLPNEDIIVDGRGIGIAKSHVIEARSQMMKSGVITIAFKADEKSKALLGHLKIETRGFVYLDEVREAHKMIIKKARASYEDTVKDIPDIEEKDLIKIIRRDLEIFLLHRLERNPVIIPIILYV